MSLSQITIMFAIILYLLLVLGIGIYYTKKNKDVNDFYLGGRKLGPFVTAMSAEASDMSGWLLMGLPGLAYLTGIADAGWTAIGLALGTYLNWILVAKRIRVYSYTINAITIPDFFSKRYNDKRNIINAVSALMILIFFIPYTASGFAVCGKLFANIFGINYITAMVISAVVIVIYTTLGGFLAASTTDFIQSIVMTFAMIFVLAYGVHASGGLDFVIDNTLAIPGYYGFSETFNNVTGQAEKYSIVSKISMLAWGLGYFGMPHILLRFMAIKDKQKLTISRRIATIWAIVSLTVAILIGVVGLSMTNAGVLKYLDNNSSETVIVNIAGLISNHNILTAICAGIILAGILAATMSTSDSQLLVASSSVSENIFNDFLKLNLGKKKSMLVARATVICISFIAIFLASNPNNSVFDIVSFAWAGFGATFGPAILCALFWKRSNLYGALSGMFTGAIIIFIWKYLIRTMGGVWDIYELLPAFIFALVINIIVSIITKGPDKKVRKEFDFYKDNLRN